MSEEYKGLLSNNDLNDEGDSKNKNPPSIKPLSGMNSFNFFREIDPITGNNKR